MRLFINQNTALVNDYHESNGLSKIETYSIRLAGSEDLKYAKIVADYLNTKHTEIIVTEQDFYVKSTTNYTDSFFIPPSKYIKQ